MPGAAASPEYDGYGLALGELEGWWGHTGVGLGYESLVIHNPDTRVTVAILMNTTLVNPNAPAELFRLMKPELEPESR